MTFRVWKIMCLWLLISVEWYLRIKILLYDVGLLSLHLLLLRIISLYLLFFSPLSPLLIYQYQNNTGKSDSESGEQKREKESVGAVAVSGGDGRCCGQFNAQYAGLILQILNQQIDICGVQKMNSGINISENVEAGSTLILHLHSHLWVSDVEIESVAPFQLTHLYHLFLQGWQCVCQQLIYLTFFRCVLFLSSADIYLRIGWWERSESGESEREGESGLSLQKERAVNYCSVVRSGSQKSLLFEICEILRGVSEIEHHLFICQHLIQFLRAKRDCIEQQCVGVK